ncbi:uncharacterized protein LOC18440543 isoform X1 [Amborella trichopoda]|uniref:uncharacterized protein LOC18440543 isoform X1 n=1 Tax=Amborella trichopoda TaxID=13333 RepID=UPI0005D3B2E0|nr:uncharacterized protein LOC18440543 isoform X1 [Amborella trichopoda]XP_020526945.1 uncharacterized protein LOC18440543 isoform X1 [Amborella trichopoda]|eukprot:XP_011625679.1 uncharacterized protein LOC18440543 isoform X1 [Amborella trichopoda]
MKEMTQSWVDIPNLPSTPASPSNSPPVFAQYQPNSCTRQSASNVFQLLTLREISPRIKRSSKRLWGEAARKNHDCSKRRCEVLDAKRGLVSWVETESLRHFSAKYCPLTPPPRSTIAAAFSPDGKTLASTHGDHTVKIIDCQTGSCLKVLSGHRRTPWVVRFHPGDSEILASGSLDHEVRLWDANTAECIGSRDFYRPIASIAFHAQGELLAVASGHKLYIWQYNRRGDASSPTSVLRTNRSLRAVHFHPHAAPFLLTAEQVTDINAPDSSMTLATSRGYLQYPPPAVFFANMRSGSGLNSEAIRDNQVPLFPYPCFFCPAAFVRDNERNSPQPDNMVVDTNSEQEITESSPSPHLTTDLNAGNQDDSLSASTNMRQQVPLSSNVALDNVTANGFLSEAEVYGQAGDMFDRRNSPSTAESVDDARSSLIVRSIDRQFADGMRATDDTTFMERTNIQMLLRSVALGQLHQFLPLGDPTCWELPFIQGWLMGQTHAGFLPVNDRSQENTIVSRGSPDAWASDPQATANMDALLIASAIAANASHSRSSGRSGSRHRSRSRSMAPIVPGAGATFMNVGGEESIPQSGAGSMDAELAAAPPSGAATAAAAESPCTVKLRLWHHDVQDPCKKLVEGRCCLTVPHAVLCSEMGAHFSPCGRFLAACVACVLPHMELDPGLQSQVHHDLGGSASSPTRHPVSAHQVVYELRIYSLEQATFGLVLASRAIRAAHCLTSIQFSPTSEHILLAYGRRHNSLLRSIVVDGATTVPIYTILEVYKVSNMELVRVLPSAEDEVNVACFHPLAGGGLVYGTKEGKLRILQYDGSHNTNSMSPYYLEENVIEVQTYAMEC